MQEVLNEPAILGIQQLQSLTSDSQRSSSLRNSGLNSQLQSLTELPPPCVRNVKIRQYHQTPLALGAGEPAKPLKAKKRMLPYKQYLTLIHS